MPANRSRTERWRENLHTLCERGGGLELSVAPADEANHVPDLMWRVCLLHVGESELIVEHPTAAGKRMKLHTGVEIVGVMVIGQNRWMFRSRVLGEKGSAHKSLPAGLRISMPADMQRCVRREFKRVSTASVVLPRVDCWPLLEPSSVVSAEVANKAMILDAGRGALSNGADELVLPEVGPHFTAELINIGGGGAGLLLNRAEASGLEHTKLLWLRVDLRPVIAAPLGMTCKVVHTHIDSGQNVYAGLSFEFAFHPSHRDFVAQQIERYVQHAQTSQRTAA